MSQLRSYKGYANTTPFQVFSFPCVLMNLDGYTAGAGWLQVHDKLSADLTNGDIPLKSIRLTAAGPIPSFMPSLGGITLLTALTVAFSSTEGTYTSASTSFDLWGEVDEFAGMSTLIEQADLQNVSNAAVTNLLGWAAATGPQRLFRATITNSGATSLYAMLFAIDSPLGYPISEWLVPAGVTKDLDFGPTGFSPMSKINGTLYQGCLIAMSTTPTTYTLPSVGESAIAIYYKSF